MEFTICDNSDNTQPMNELILVVLSASARPRIWTSTKVQYWAHFFTFDLLIGE